MKKLLALAAASTLLTSTALAQWAHEVTIEVGDDIVGSLKSIAASPDGDTLYFTTYFGSGPRPIYMIADPLGADPAVDVFADPAYGSTNGSGLTVDPVGNVFFTHDTNDAATSYLQKYDSAGNLVTSFGTNGTVSPVVFNVGGAPTNHRPRESSWVAGDRLLVSNFAMDRLLHVFDAETGNPIGGAINIGTPTGITDAMHGMAYDPATNVIVGTIRGTAWTIVSDDPAASLDDLSDYDDFTQIAGEVWPGGNSNMGGSSDEAANLFTFTSSKVSPGTVTVLDLADPDDQTVLGEGLNEGDPGYLGSSGDSTFFRSGGNLYLAVNAENRGEIVIFSYTDPTSVEHWTIMD